MAPSAVVLARFVLALTLGFTLFAGACQVAGGGASGGGTSGGTGATTGTGTGAASGTGTGGTGSGGSVAPPPVSCSEAAQPYTISAAMLDATLVPTANVSGGNSTELPVAVDATTGDLYVGFTRTEGTTRSAVIVSASGAGAPIVIAGAANAGIAATNDGVAVLLFDPNTNVSSRMWAAVKRFRKDGSEAWSRDLFRSPNLDDVGTKGAPSTSRFGYLPGSDQLLAYFGHTERNSDGVRHQGGFVGRMDAAGTLEMLSGWWGSHNLDQRLLVRANAFSLLGLGDAYPEGMFFGNAAPRMRTAVVQPLASAGNGTTNGQLGGMVDLDDLLLIPFITNRSVAPDLDAGTWPNIDDAIATQIRNAAQNGTDLGLVRLNPASQVPMGGVPAVWLDPQRASTARLERLKSARYGAGGLALLAFAESTGTGQSAMRNYYTIVIDREGAICQPKTPLDAAYAPTAGDDFVRAPDGRIIWARPQGGRIHVVTLTPGKAP